MARKEVRASFVAERVSLKQSVEVANMIRRLPLRKAKGILNEVSGGRKTVDGSRTYPKTTQAFLTLLGSAEANAKQKKMDAERLFVRSVKADQGFKYIRPKSLAKFRGREAKVSNLSVVLEER